MQQSTPQSHGPRMCRATTAVVAVTLAGTLLTSCVRGRSLVDEPDDPTGPSGAVGYAPPPPSGGAVAPTESDTVFATPALNAPGFAIPANFLGLSFEAWDATDAPRLTDPALPQFLKNLGAGVLRYGGSTADQQCWNPSTRTVCPAGGPTLINSDFANVFSFSHATGWPVIYTVNLVGLHPDTAAAEVAALSSAGSTALLTVAIGNEPDQYVTQGLRANGWGYTQYQGEWESYANAITARSPTVKFSGVDGCCALGTTWMSPFVGAEDSRMVLAAGHLYPTFNGATSGTTYYPSIANLLSQYTQNRVISDVQQLYAGDAGRLPLRITESNSVGGSGLQGVSNVYASALWAVAHMFVLAENGAVGVNFHGSFSGGNYEAVSGGGGSYVAHPLYYAMLLFHNAAQGQTIPVSVVAHNSPNVMIHAALGSDGTLRVVAINNEASTNVQVRIAPGRSFRSAGTLRMTGPSLDATSGVTYAGATVGADGTWVPGTYSPVYTTGGVYAVSVPASSVAVVTLVP
jgi:Glycosyl hydrolase family 79 C-terminal beta domain